jgi:hypothetical protein
VLELDRPFDDVGRCWFCSAGEAAGVDVGWLWAGEAVLGIGAGVDACATVFCAALTALDWAGVLEVATGGL